ncbi:hypothetical protein [Psychroserpens algicola]|uniref:Transposase n=1 Tax=Psychroserpens algicola TaxID=1719034 RepID=A0ABT0H4A8_9FLAO|nr:hypothetical protein [Psychroserpens algicola]MCK8479183.1 hypothetical protein [Psychroserpens algicola]
MKTKKTKYSIYSTDYFFEGIYHKIKASILSINRSKLAAIKMLFIVSWFKDIN